MTSSGEQHELLKSWAAGTDFVLDSSNQPKVEFARLAKVKGWVGGDANWCEHWHACFGEEYRYGTRRKFYIPPEYAKRDERTNHMYGCDQKYN